MATDANSIHRQHKQHLKEELDDHRDVLEAVAALDNPLSSDAEQALAILEELET